VGFVEWFFGPVTKIQKVSKNSQKVSKITKNESKLIKNGRKVTKMIFFDFSG
tara:strand:+ start:349 stop:504 length:156 start_codon:yes stop_codon:yes gene_type:complete